MRRSLLGPVLSLALAGAALSGCGGDADAPSPSTPSTGPLARWRRAVEPVPEGMPVTIDALRPCVVRLLYWEDGRATERERREMAAGDVWRVLVQAAKRPMPGAIDPSADDRANGRTHATVYAFTYSSDDRLGVPTFVAAWTRSETPWVELRAAESPPTALDLPREPITMVAVGVTEPDPAPDALRLELAYPPRIVGPASHAGRKRVAAWILEVVPPS